MSIHTEPNSIECLDIPKYKLFHCLFCNGYDLNLVLENSCEPIENSNTWVCEKCGKMNQKDLSFIRLLTRKESVEYYDLMGGDEIDLPYFIRIKMPDYQKEKEMKEKAVNEFILKLFK